ncbi:MAG: PepSY domain-containing protein [Azonexus sp.]|nr:PepSY domain-containing protein [Azonexus sp.]
MIWRKLLLTGLAAATLAAPVIADDDHEMARRALAAGEILPLRAVLDRINSQYPGEVLEIELDDEKGRWVYEIKLLAANGGVRKLLIDAKDASVIAERDKSPRR